MRIIGGLFLISCGSFAGIAAGSRLKKQLRQCEILCNYLAFLKSELEYSCAPLEQIAYRLYCNPNFSKFEFARRCSFDENNRPFFVRFRCAAEELQQSFGKEVYACLEELSGQLGNYPLDAQLAAISRCRSQIEDFVNAHRFRYTQNIKLYRTMGLLSGAAFVILLW